MANTREQGFTLLELLIVIAVIAILSATLLTTISNAKRRALDSATQTYVRNLAGYFVAYHTKNPQEDLSGITTCNDSKLVSEGAPDPIPENIVSSCTVTVTANRAIFTAISLGGKTLSYSW